MTTRPGYVWDATANEWVEIGQAAVLAPIAYQASAPSSPATGDIWIDSDDDVPSVGDSYTKAQTDTLLDAKSPVSTTGLVLINTTTFTTQASVSFNDVFSATYNNYLIQMSLDGSTTNQNVNFRLRPTGGPDNSNANYSRSNFVQQSTNVTGQSLTGQTSWLSVCEVVSTMRQYADLTVFNPFLTQYTGGIGNSLSVTNGATYQERITFGTTITTSYTGFTLIPEAGTITGTVSIYGYK